MVSSRSNALRRWWYWVASVAALSTLTAACGGSADAPASSGDTGSAAEGAQDEVELVVFGPSVVDRLAGETPEDVQARVEQEVLEGFAEEHEAVSRVSWPAEGPVQDSVQSLLSAHLAGEQFDLIACSANPTNGAYARRGVLLDITDQIGEFQDRFDESALEAWTFGGRVLGVPISPLVTSTFFYNMDMFEELGLEEPETYDDLIAVSQQLRDAGKIPLLHQGSVSQKWPQWYFEAAAQTMDDSVEKTISNLRGETSFTDPEDVEAFRLVGQFVKDGILDQDSLGADADAMRAAFSSGRSAMFYGGTWELGWVLETDFEVGAFRFPKLPDAPNEPTHGGGPDLGICLYSGIAEEKIPYAIDFLEYLSRPEIANIYLAPTNPPASAIEGVEVSDTEMAQELREENFPNTTMFLDWIWPAEISDAVGKAIQGIIAGDVTPEDAAAGVQEVYDGLVEEGYTYEE